MKTELIKIDFAKPLSGQLSLPAKILAEGGLVAFPTETVYGLGGNALDASAAGKIYAAKGRPSDNPLIVHIARPGDAAKYADTNPLYEALAKAFMPGPLTVVLPKKEIIPFSVTGGLQTVGIRCPGDPVARELIRLAGVPIAAPSANVSGRPSPTAASHVADDLNGRIDCIIDGGEAEVGLESTIVKIDGDRLILLRPGAITPEMLRTVCENVVLDNGILGKLPEGVSPQAPGMKYRHYAPEASVEILVGSEEMVERFLSDKTDFAVICYSGDKKLQKNKNVLILGDENDSQEQASKLFSCLRECDKDKSIKNIYARMPKKNGVGLAVYNRLIKAAGFKITELK